MEAKYKNVMAASSEYFETLTSTSLHEDKSTCQIPGVDSDIMETIIKYIYTSEIQLDWNTVEPLLSAADFLLCKTVNEMCLEFLDMETNMLIASETRQKLSVSKMLRVKELLDRFPSNRSVYLKEFGYVYEDINSKIMDIIQKNMKEIISSKEILEVPFEVVHAI